MIESSQIVESDHETAGDTASCAVVAIGASAGGLEAVIELLKHLQPPTGMAFVLIQHLDPSHGSDLAAILTNATTMRVVEATEAVEIEADHLYVIPPNTLMAIRSCHLYLSPRENNVLPIDHFMCSLAEDLGYRSIGVILSGGGSDGTLGLAAIKSEGGITFAQDQTARHESMPRHAASTGVVDFIFSPQQIARELATLTSHIQLGTSSAGTLFKNGPVLQRILAIVRDRCRVDFSHYKINTIQRRLTRRMTLQHLNSPEEYLSVLEESDREAQDLLDDILITVTQFFRDPPVFDSFVEHAIPHIFKDRGPDDPIRVWVPGCSTGKEVYSIAITLIEGMEKSGRPCQVQLFGTDISDRSVEKARAGKYPESIATTISPERLERFFVRIEGGYQIARRIREICVFSRQDVTRDPPLARMDLISCRNLLIYLGPVLQRRVVAIFGYSLKPNGFLLLGNSEGIGALSNHFRPIDAKHKIYQRDGYTPAPNISEFPVVPLRLPSLFRPPLLRRVDESGALDRLADRILLEQYAPPGFLLNSERQVVRFRGDVGTYLTPRSSDATLDVLTLVRPDVLRVLRPALDAAMSTGRVARERFNPVPGGGVEIIVRPIIEPRIECHYLVVFEEEVHRERLQGGAAPQSAFAEERLPSAGDLALDLASTRAYMQRLVEELRSANEEAQSSNEELQSTNEELQTAKEELQSSNEELATTNEEMQSRNSELNLVNADLVNLLSSLEVAILMLDRDLRIRRYTPVCTKLFTLIPSDLGRPISDLRAAIDIPRLNETLQRVIASGEPCQMEVQDDGRHWYSLWVQPYRTADNRIDGVVIQMFDIDALKRSIDEVARARDYADAIVATVRESLVVLDSALRVQTVNQSFCSMFGATQGGTSIYEIASGCWDVPQVHELLNATLRGGAPPPDVEIELNSATNSRKTFLLSARRIGAEPAESSILLAIEDISDRKRAAEAKYRRLFETAKDGILIMDASNGIVTDVNPRALHLVGHQREQMIGRCFWDVLPLAGGDVEGRQNLERLRAHEMVRFTEVEFEVDGIQRVIETVGNMYREDELQVIQLNLRDITQRRRFEQQLQQTAKLESLGILAGGIAHDFNNLLAGIMGNASLALLDAKGSPRYQSGLRDVVRASQRAAELTSQMLAYAGKGRYVVRQADMSEMVRDISALVLTSIPKTVRVELNLASGLPAVEADVSQLQQVIMNLIINGAESIAEGRSGFVRIITAADDFNPARHHIRIAAEGIQPGRFVVLEVSDSGSGMSEAVLARIFDPFFTTKFTGRGLGLAAVQGIVRGHGGALTVHSEPGKGTTFRVFIPASTRGKAVPEKQPDPDELRGEGTILVVDDEADVATMAQAVLESHGYKTVTAGNGEIAIRILRERGAEISAVILDLTMPVMGGEEAVGPIRELYPSLPVILSTGYDSSEVGDRIRAESISGVLQKPYTAQGLLQLVKEAILRK